MGNMCYYDLCLQEFWIIDSRQGASGVFRGRGGSSVGFHDI